MIRRLHALNLIGATLAVTLMLSSTTAFAGPLIGRPIRAPEPPVTGNTKQEEPGSDDSGTGGTTTTNGTTNSTPSAGTSPEPPTNTSTSTARLQAAQLKMCQARSATINTIMTRASTRAANQITLFSTVATKVEAYYTSQGKTAATYDQLVTAVNTAVSQASTAQATLKAASTFSCSTTNPMSTVSTYRSDLQTEQVDLQTLRTAVRSLIVAVAQAEGVTLSQSATKGAQQ